MEIIVEVQTCLNDLVTVFNSKLFGNFDHLVPGLRDISICQTCFLPHIFVVVYRSGHHTVINIVNLSIDHMGTYTIEICLQILCGDIKRSHVIDQVLMVAVMYVENSRSVVSIQCKRKLCPVILPWVINKIDGYIWMNGCVSVDDLLEQLVTAPLPKLYGDVFSIIDLHAWVIFDRISERLCRCLCLGFGFAVTSGRTSCTATSCKCSYNHCCSNYRCKNSLFHALPLSFRYFPVF